MRILILSLGFGLKEHNLFGPLSETFIELANLGHQLVIVSRDKNSESAKKYYECKNGGSVTVIKLTQKVGIKKYLFPFEVYYTLKQLHKQYNFELVYSHIIPFMTFPALFFKSKYKIKHIYWVCSDWIEDKKWWKNTMNEFIQKNIQKYTDIVLTCTNYCKENDHKRFGTDLLKYKILPNSVNLERYKSIDYIKANDILKHKYEIDDSKKIILYFSSLSFRKGAISLVKSIEYLANKRDDFIVLFCGPGNNNEIEQLSLILKQGNLNKYAIFAGAISSSDAPIYYNGCDIFCVLPEYEGFGRVFVEASAAKKPIVASNVGGIPEVIQNNKDGLLVERDDYEKIAKALLYLLDNTEIAKTYANNAYSNVLNKYDVKVVAKNMEKIFKEVIS